MASSTMTPPSQQPQPWRGRSRGRPRGDERNAFYATTTHGRQSASWRATTAIAPAPPLGEVLKIIKLDELTPKLVDYFYPPTISECEYIASYNWTKTDNKTNDAKPMILIPGKPPVWTPLGEPKQLEEDSGDFFRDPNAARYPVHPTEPAVRAILEENPDFPTSKVDIFACGSTMGNLLRFVRRDSNKPFRFSVEAVGETVFFVRRENSPTEKIPDVRGYGHTFPDTYCSWEDEVEGSESHQRLIWYTFAGLKCVVRSKCDGYLKDWAGTVAPAPEKDRDIVSSISTATSDLQSQKAGRQVSQRSIFDLKTRSVKRRDADTLKEELGRLWLTQIPNFILAYHDRGTFHDNDIHVTDAREEVKKWELENRDSLRQLSALIRKTAAFAKARPDGRCEVFRRDSGAIVLLEQMDGVSPALPDALSSIWASGALTSTSDSNSDGSASDDHSSDRRYFSDEEDHFSFGSGPVLDGEESDKDYTACSASDCGYCGHCEY